MTNLKQERKGESGDTEKTERTGTTNCFFSHQGEVENAVAYVFCMWMVQDFSVGARECVASERPH